MQSFKKAITCALIGTAALAFSSMTASASIVCSGNACWHTHETFDYPPSAHVVIHPDNWRWGANDHYVWREHAGRGYWSGDHWVEVER